MELLALLTSTLGVGRRAFGVLSEIQYFRHSSLMPVRLGLTLVLFVANLLHSFDRLAVHWFLNGSGHSDLREAMSMEKRYFTSDLSSLS
jgi:hypothetical protein